MRNQYRLLLFRSLTRSPLQAQATNLQLHKVHRYFSHLSSLRTHTLHETTLSSNPTSPRFRSFSTESSESAVDLTNELDHVALTDILSKASTIDEVKTGLESIGLEINHEVVLNVLRSLEGSSPETAWKFFNIVKESEHEKVLSSKSYNLMLGMFGSKDYVKEFWGLVELMKNKKGYGVSKRAYMKALESFEKEKMVEDLGRLKKLYAKPDENSVERVSSRVVKVVRENEWDEETQKKLRDLNSSWSNDLVKMAIEQLNVYPMKALMFFWWVEEDSSFKHDKATYDAMLKVLSREDCIDKFWRIVDEMKGAGYQMDKEMYLYVVERFHKRRMIKDAVDLHEFFMSGGIKPSVQETVFLLRKIAVSKELDIELFSRVLKIFVDAGNSLTESILLSVVRSLISVGRLQESGKILKAMEEGGLLPSKETYNRIIFHLGSVEKSDEAIKIIDEMEASECKPDFRTWSALIHGQCVARDLNKASSSFRSMVEKFGVEDAGYAFDVLIGGFCQQKRAEDAYKLLSEMVNAKDLRPWHETYQHLIKKLLTRGNFSEALTLLSLMKGNGYPPYLVPFFGDISKSRTGTDAAKFLKAVSDKGFPSNSVVIQMFEAFFKAGRHSEAHNLLSECPSYIRSHADVLNLFCSQKSEDASALVS